MAKNREFVCPNVAKTINTVAGTAHYLKTEIEDDLGRWNDNYYTRDGYWVIHEGRQHHVYKIPPKGKGWYEKPDYTGKAPEHHKVACKAQARTANNKPMGRMSSEPEWYQDAETNTYKVWKTHYKGFWATVYHVGKETGSDTEGWEYELYREKPHAEYNSLYDSSTGGDHAKDAETAMQWAINTINEWG